MNIELETKRTPKVILAVMPDADSCNQLSQDLSFFLDQVGEKKRVVCSFSTWEVLPFDTLSPTSAISAERLNTLDRLSSEKATVVVTSVAALRQKIIPPEKFKASIYQISEANYLERDQVLEHLLSLGYQRSSLVEDLGQFALRGSVLDLFSPNYSFPVRVELFSDKVQSIRFFDPGEQRTLSEISAVRILPIREFFKTKSNSEILSSIESRARELEVPPRTFREIEDAISNDIHWPGLEHFVPIVESRLVGLWDYLPADSLVVNFDSTSTNAAIDQFSSLLDEREKKAIEETRIYPKLSDAYFTTAEFEEKFDSLTSLKFESISFLGSDKDIKPEIFSNSGLKKELSISKSKEFPLRPLIEELEKKEAQNYKLGIVVGHDSREKRIANLLFDNQKEAQNVFSDFYSWEKSTDVGVSLVKGDISAGLSYPAKKIQLISDREIFPDIVSRRRSKPATNIKRFLGSAAQLTEGDCVVHLEHGIGLYHGLVQISVDGKLGDFLSLEYAEKAKLFIPVEHISKIQKYVSKEGTIPNLSRLGAGSWEKTKKKVHANVAELAGQLLNLYAERETKEGFSFGEVDSEDLHFADTFQFEETPDQEKAIGDVLGDMSAERPMDRLVCGDVGYGKTEVALRAAFKAANKGKQVAVLVPTTVLAEQHYKTFKARLEEFPFSLACLSRFAGPKENKDSLEKLRRGELDIVIGTHRLLQKDVEFFDLGLLIVDEEHRFGVANKEKLKQFKKEVDVLTLTATPIPRTLHMSLVGIRELSVIETAPHDRQVTRTYVSTYEDGVVREAVLRELGRSGQVFYIYNRVQTIAQIADELKELVPEARIEFAHGQMKENELAEKMHRFVQHEIDILVSTTIVESGLDIPNANTIIIRDANIFGLAELYQLRGRVGRSSKRAYAYLLVSDPKKLRDDAKKRLEVLQNLDDLGQGFRLALQDMEIRGAGNLLGKDQSGQINAVGFELYSQILKDAVKQLKLSSGQHEEEIVVDPELKIGFPAHIPIFYIPDVAERLLLYQRLVALESEDEAYQLHEEIEDRFGRLPEEVEQLVSLMRFRALLKRAKIIKASFRNSLLSFSFHEKTKLDIDKVMQVVAGSSGRVKLSPSMLISLRIEEDVESPEVLRRNLESLLNSFSISS